MELTQERVRELFDYREDGSLIRRKRSGPRKAGTVSGSVDSRGHLQVRVDGRLIQSHRVIFLWHYGYMPVEVDHKDTNKTNNRIENLRPATRSENMFNRPARRDSRSGVKGVRLEKSTGKWIARIQKNKRRVLIGRFNTMEEAKAAFKAAAIELHGDFARP